MSWVAALAWSTAVAWLLATAISQGRGRVPQRIKAADRLSLLPAWTFFAPNPGIHDHVVVVRHLRGEEWSQWQIVWKEDSNRWRAIWRPSKRESKLVTDAVGTWAELQRTLAPGDSCYSLSFLLLASLAERSASIPPGAAYQFGVADVIGLLQRAPVLVTFLVSPTLRREISPHAGR